MNITTYNNSLKKSLKTGFSFSVHMTFGLSARKRVIQHQNEERLHQTLLHSSVYKTFDILSHHLQYCLQ
jgi:hypothetical protein